MDNLFEILGVILNVAYLILLIKRSVYCWPAGILGSGLGIYVFIQSQLYSEAILFTFYVLIGIYGWVNWQNAAGAKDTVSPIVWKLKNHLTSIAAGVIVSMGLGYYFDNYTDAERAYLDAFSTGFAFIASFLEAKRVLSGWFYWIALNGFSIWLYADRGLELYAGLSVLYTVMSVYGYYNWRRAREEDLLSNSNILDEPGF